MNNPTCLHISVVLVGISLENIFPVHGSLQGLPQKHVVYLAKILHLNSPNGEDRPLALLHWLNYQLPAGKQPITVLSLL